MYYYIRCVVFKHLYEELQEKIGRSGRRCPKCGENITAVEDAYYYGRNY